MGSTRCTEQCTRRQTASVWRARVDVERRRAALRPPEPPVREGLVATLVHALRAGVREVHVVPRAPVADAPALVPDATSKKPP